jgi:hypothetical protein
MSASAVLPAFPPLQALLARVSHEVRLRRAERGAWRGAFWGAVAAVVVVAFKGALADAAVPAALILLLAAPIIEAVRSACRKVDPLTAARLADRRLGLSDRVATAVEWAGQREKTAFSDALMADALAQVERVRSGSGGFLQRAVPREARFLVVPLIALAVLVQAPPIPGPEDWLQQLRSGKSRDEAPSLSLMDRLKALSGNLLQKNPFSTQEAAPANASDAKSATEAAEFKDKAIAKQRSDFSSFVKKGDERLRMLERTDKLPDLQSDFASSKYKMLLRKSQELSSGNGPGQLSAAKLSQILKEMERLGKRNGDWSDDVNDGLQALQEGQTEEAMEAMENALGKIRDAEDRQRSSKALRGGRDAAEERDAASSESSSLSFNDADRRGGYSQAKGGASKGAPTARLRSTPYDTGVQGQRGGRMPSYETQSTGRPGSLGMQLQYSGEMGQYRRLMEDAIAREQVPRDYHNQIRDYFKSLNEQ